MKDAKEDPLMQTRAFGKLILFGEHFVVYNVPALVGAVAASTVCKMEFSDEPGVKIVDNRPAVPNYKVKKAEEGKEAVELVLKHFKLEGKGVKVTFGGDLCCVSGIGASAAQTVSLSRAIAQTLPLDLTEEEINAAGYEGEKGYHGTPSGIDNTAATFGGLLKFQRRTGQDPIFVKKKIPEPIRIVYASTGITSSTTTVVGDVRAKKEKDPQWFDGLMTKYLALVEKGEKAIDEGDMETLGTLLNENHVLCQELTVSCKELDDLVDAARAAGATGAKMSGTGRGGLMVSTAFLFWLCLQSTSFIFIGFIFFKSQLALTPTEEIQNAVSEALEKIAPQVWKTCFQ